MESGIKQEFTKEEKDAAAERVYKIVESLNTSIEDLQKTGLRVEVIQSRNILTGNAAVHCHVFEHICYNQKGAEKEI